LNKNFKLISKSVATTAAQGKILFIRETSIKKNARIQISSNEAEVNVSVTAIATDIEGATRNIVSRGVGPTTAAIGA
jgi:hypothetical protein